MSTGNVAATRAPSDIPSSENAPVQRPNTSDSLTPPVSGQEGEVGALYDVQVNVASGNVYHLPVQPQSSVGRRGDLDSIGLDHVPQPVISSHSCTALDTVPDSSESSGHVILAVLT